MTTASQTATRQVPSDGPAYIFHPSFEERDAELRYAPTFPTRAKHDHLTDDETKKLTQCMHYAGWRRSRSRTTQHKSKWEDQYLRCRDEIVTGNHKLVYRAVHRWRPARSQVDEMIGSCQIVFIQAVAAYNPWVGVRFSTYTFTCLMRALSRLSQRQANDRFAHSLPLDIFPEGEPRAAVPEESPESKLHRVYEFLKDQHPLLSDREKKVIIHRYTLGREHKKKGTLAEVGKRLGLSKERVRQLQITALGKIRKALGVNDELC